jgi:excisionase family DNA binding protein
MEPTMAESHLLTRKQAAAYLNLPKSVLDADVSRKRLNLPEIRCGRYIRYRLADLESWLNAHLDGGMQ